MSNYQDAYDELYIYTMGRPRFILQHVVDARAAQTADENSKPISVVFALAGLYLHLERAYTGSEVQNVHRHMGQRKREWPRLALPRDRGAITSVDVLAVAAGTERHAAIDRWCESIWHAYADSRDTIIQLLKEYGIS